MAAPDGGSLEGLVQLQAATLDPQNRTGDFSLREALLCPQPGHVEVAHHWGISPLRLRNAPRKTLYEQYHPYGTSAYRAQDGTFGVSAKRYRYNGKERDEETKLYYYGARYYASWLGRWTAADPLAFADGVGAYTYVRGSPVVLSDPNGKQGDGTVVGPPNVQDPKVLLEVQLTKLGRQAGEAIERGDDAAFKALSKRIGQLSREYALEVRSEAWAKNPRFSSAKKETPRSPTVLDVLDSERRPNEWRQDKPAKTRTVIVTDAVGKERTLSESEYNLEAAAKGLPPLPAPEDDDDHQAGDEQGRDPKGRYLPLEEGEARSGSEWEEEAREMLEEYVARRPHLQLYRGPVVVVDAKGMRRHFDAAIVNTKTGKGIGLEFKGANARVSMRQRIFATNLNLHRENVAYGTGEHEGLIIHRAAPPIRPSTSIRQNIPPPVRPSGGALRTMPRARR